MMRPVTPLRHTAPLLTALLLCFTAAAHGETNHAELERLRTENAALRDRIEALEAERQALRGELAELRQDNSRLENQAEVLEQQTDELQALAGLSTDDEAAAEQNARIQRADDKKNGRTVVTFGPEPLEAQGSPGQTYFSVVFSHPVDGRPADAETVSLFIQTQRAGRNFDNRDSVTFLLDGEPLELTVDGYDVDARRSGIAGKTRNDRSDETLTFRLDRETFEHLSAAGSLAVTAGRVTLTFDRDDRAALRAMHRRLSGETP